MLKANGIDLRLMTCPSCDSHNVRLSHKHSKLEFIYQWQGLQRYRCRECGLGFRSRLEPEAKQALHRTESERKKRSRGWKRFIQNPKKRRFFEIALFLGMLFIFYYAFTSLVATDGSGFFAHPVQNKP